MGDAVIVDEDCKEIVKKNEAFFAIIIINSWLDCC